MKSFIHVLTLFAMLSWCIVSTASGQARDSAFSKPERSWSTGIFNPLRYQLSQDWAIEGHPLVQMAHPHARLTHVWAEGKNWALAGRYGLSSPSWSLNFGVPFGLRGYLSPRCVVSQAEPERGLDCTQHSWALAPEVGVRYSLKKNWTLTIDVDTAIGVLISGQRPTPLDTYAPLDLVYAPLTRTHRTHLGARLSLPVFAGLMVTGEVNLYVMDDRGGRSPVTVSSYFGFDYPITQHLTVTTGFIYFNHDQRAMALVTDSDGFSRKTLKRSHDVYPTADLIWSY